LSKDKNPSESFSDRNELLAAIHSLLETEKQSNPTSYNVDGPPYQAYERIGFPGSRWSVERRISDYDLDQFYNPKANILDIGSNSGFFVTEFGMHCQNAHGVEPTPELNRVGEITAKHLNIADKVKFYDCKFEDFVPELEYDTVLSLAAFYTFDGRERSSAKSYFDKIYEILKPDGYCFYESTSHTKEAGSPGLPFLLAAQEAEAALIKTFKIEKSWEEETRLNSGSFRKYIVARKQK
jgi:hypothetical protein